MLLAAGGGCTASRSDQPGLGKVDEVSWKVPTECDCVLIAMHLANDELVVTVMHAPFFSLSKPKGDGSVKEQLLSSGRLSQILQSKEICAFGDRVLFN